MTELIKATRKFIAICRDDGNEAVRTAAVDYAQAVEAHISGLQMEIDDLTYAISKLRREINLHVDIMRSYGIDPKQLANRSIYQIMGDIQMADLYGTIRRPEKHTQQ